jgi:hypothetical protein
MTQYVLRTEAIGDPKYFAGTVELPMGFGVTLTKIIFGAFIFDDEGDAKQAVKDMPDYSFTVSPCEFGMSDSLAQGT